MSIYAPPDHDASPDHKSLLCNLLVFSNNSPVPIYTPGRKETLSVMRVECLAQEHSTMSLAARARIWTARSGDEHTNPEARYPVSEIYCTIILHVEHLRSLFTASFPFLSSLLVNNNLCWLNFSLFGVTLLDGGCYSQGCHGYIYTQPLHTLNAPQS